MTISTRILFVTLIAVILVVDSDESGGLSLSPAVGWVPAALMAIVAAQLLADGWSGRRLTKPRDFGSHASVVVPGQLSAVWEALVDPRTEVALNETLVSGGRLGAERGVGEVQCFLKEDDGGRRLSGVEVIEYEHDRRALTRSLVRGMEDHWTETTVEQVGPDQVRIDLSHRMHARKGMRAAGMRSFTRAFDEHATASAQEYENYFRDLADERSAQPKE